MRQDEDVPIAQGNGANDAAITLLDPLGTRLEPLHQAHGYPKMANEYISEHKPSFVYVNSGLGMYAWILE